MAQVSRETRQLLQCPAWCVVQDRDPISTVKNNSEDNGPVKQGRHFSLLCLEEERRAVWSRALGTPAWAGAGAATMQPWNDGI